ncbi:MAG: hypothetical protein QOJ46_2562 [bacterium]|jgi:hypothetical protein
MVLTPIRPGLQGELRAYLDGLADESPLARLPRTHFARLMIVPDMPAGASYRDPLDGPYLLFTANFDGDVDSWLDELAELLVPEVQEIWGRCIGCPEPASGAALKAYLWRNQLDSGVVFAAYGQASVAQIRGALDKRARLADFVVRAQDMEPADRRRAFLEEFGVA